MTLLHQVLGELGADLTGPGDDVTHDSSKIVSTALELVSPP
jgi:hypothetical protein